MFDVVAVNTRTKREICESFEDMRDAQAARDKIVAHRWPDGTPMYRDVGIQPHLFDVPEGEKQLNLF